MIKLYPYQESAVSHAVTMLSQNSNSLIVAGTGAGKTIMMAGAIGRFISGFAAINKRKPHVLVLVHRTEIHGQNHSKFSNVCPEIPTSEITSSRKSLHGNVHFGMVQTVVNVLPQLEKSKSYFDLIVIDEAHHSAASTYIEIIDWNKKGNPNMALLGVTATPNRGDKLPLIHLFDNFYQITTKFLIDSHYLVRPKFKDLSPVFKVEKGSFTVAEKGKLSKNCRDDFEGRLLIKKLCTDYLENKEEGKSIIFAPSHSFCQIILDNLRKLGRQPAYLAPGIDEISRKEELERFESGNAQELINVDICTEGYDYPPLRNLVDFDTNGTHGQWVQKVGRVLRTTPGKTSCTVIDFGGNVALYPDGVETDVDLDGVVKKPKGEKITEEDFFRKKTDKFTLEVLGSENTEYTPYNLPEGVESINDKDLGVAFILCGTTRDGIIVNIKENYGLFMTNKQSLTFDSLGGFDVCIKKCLENVGKVTNDKKPISNMQIKLLAPEYPTMTLDWHGANCCICFKTWKSKIMEMLKNDNQ